MTEFRDREAKKGHHHQIICSGPVGHCQSTPDPIDHNRQQLRFLNAVFISFDALHIRYKLQTYKNKNLKDISTGTYLANYDRLIFLNQANKCLTKTQSLFALQ